MALIKLICKHCNGQMELDDSLETATCRFCSTKHIIVRGAGATDCKDVEEYVKDGIVFIELRQFDRAYEYFKKATDADPMNAKAWIWCATAMSLSSSRTLCSDASSAFEKAYRLSDNDEDRSSVIWLWLAYIKDIDSTYDTVDDAHKEIVIIKTIEGLEKSALTYFDAYKFLCRVRGEEYVKETMVSKWVEQLKSTLSAGIVYPDPFLVDIVYYHLNDEEKRKAVSLLAKDACRYARDTDHHQKRRDVVLRLSVEDHIAFKAAINVESFLTFKESIQLAKEKATLSRSKKEAEKKERKSDKKHGLFSR